MILITDMEDEALILSVESIFILSDNKSRTRQEQVTLTGAETGAFRVALEEIRHDYPLKISNSRK